MSFENVCRRLLEYGVLAPSIYNSQPWKFSMDASKGVIEIYPDETRSRPFELDPSQKDLYLALGACVENMVLAGPSLGYEVATSFFPQAASVRTQAPVARLSLKPTSEVMPDPLFSTLMIRHTHAGAYQAASAAEIHIDRLRAIPAFSEKESIYILTEDSKREDLYNFLHDLAHEGSLNAVMVKEAADWITPKSNALSGLPISSVGLPSSVKFHFALERYLVPAKALKKLAKETLLRQGHGIEAPAFLLMTTRNPNREGYLNAGRWMERIQLTLNEMELGFQALHLPISLTFCHADLCSRFGPTTGEEPVLLLRFGSPIHKKWPQTHRRAVEESLLKRE